MSSSNCIYVYIVKDHSQIQTSEDFSKLVAPLSSCRHNEKHNKTCRSYYFHEEIGKTLGDNDRNQIYFLDFPKQ